MKTIEQGVSVFLENAKKLKTKWSPVVPQGVIATLCRTYLTLLVQTDPSVGAGKYLGLRIKLDSTLADLRDTISEITGIENEVVQTLFEAFVRDILFVPSQEYVVAAISSNTNSFGLHQVIVISTTEQKGYKAASSAFNLPTIGAKITIPPNTGVTYALMGRGWELVEQLSNVPDDVYEEIKKKFNF